MQPLLAVAFVALLAWLFGYMQRNHNWFNDAATTEVDGSQEDGSQYACSMLCVFVSAPGRCPVCGMQLQKIESSGDPKDIYGVTIDPAARRLANIKTTVALRHAVAKETTVLGRIVYDETSEATVSTYVDGRIEDLLIDYTGATVSKGDELAVIYSPDLYADQVGLLQAKAAAEKPTENDRVDRTNQRLYESSRHRLIERGIPQSQVTAIESSGKARNRIKIHAPISGTIVKKLAEEGTYVKTGTPILKLADLSKVWMMLEIPPTNTSELKLGQTVTLEVQSQAGKKFQGEISFIAPDVDTTTQTVKVRVAISNDAGLLKIGDLGKATIQSAPGDELVIVPRESVLVNGPTSIAYVETDPGRFEFRKVKIAEFVGDQVTLLEGIEPGEQVVSSGAFMLDSSFNIQGKVSLIDPNRAIPQNHSQIAKNEAEASEIETSFKSLSPEDRAFAERQVICPVTEVKLGTMGMGTPIKVDVQGTPVMICCEGCRGALLSDPQKHFSILDQYHERSEKTDADVGDELPQMELPEMELPQLEAPE